MPGIIGYWGNWVLEKVKAEIGDLYPLIPDPKFKGTTPLRQADMWQSSNDEVPLGYLVPVAYLWTRTVRCKNPTCGATVPLVKQTWLCKKEGQYVALKIVAPKGKKQVRFEVVEAASEGGLGFDPGAGSKAGNATCPFCGTVADSDYVKAEGCAERIGQQMMAIVCTRHGKQGKVYVSADEYQNFAPNDEAVRQRIEALCQRTDLTVPNELLPRRSKSPDDFRGTLGIGIQPYGILTFGNLWVCQLHMAPFDHLIWPHRGYGFEYPPRAKSEPGGRARGLGAALR